jgi:hypothetical protein
MRKFGLSIPLSALLALNLAVVPRVCNAKTDLQPVDLRCEYAVDPLGVDSPNPRLSWKLESNGRNHSQKAYRILVASTVKSLKRDTGDFWDAGEVHSGETIHIPYFGKPFHSSQRAYWKVRVWDQDGNPSPWSKTASWTYGILDSTDWKAEWIGAAPESPEAATLLLRREFTVKKGLKRAVAHFCGLGCFEMTLNGEKAGRELFPPGWTKYDKTCLYVTYDLTSMLRKGRNTVGLLLGNGMYNVKGGRYAKFTGSFGPLKAIGQIVLEYKDGTKEAVVTDGTWRVHPGPITFSCVFGGEDVDLRLEPEGWNRSGFNDAAWTKASILPGPGGKLKGLSASAPPVLAFETFPPVGRKEIKPGVMVYDLGQNVSLMPRLKVKGQSGSVVRIIPSELLNADGSVDRTSCAHGAGPAWWQVTLAGGGSGTWFPKFFYHGCRYLQVECMPAVPGGKPSVVKSIEGVVVHSDSEPVGEFKCSNDLFNRIHALVRWAQRSNMMHVLMDCPHRERLGWIEQYHLNGPSLRYEFDLSRLFAKGVNDMADSQLENGLVPDIAPEYTVFEAGFRDSPEWGSAFILVPWQQFEWTGDTDLLERHFESMKRYVSYLETKSSGFILSHGLGDWYDIGPMRPGYAQLTPVALTATAFFYEDAKILSQAAALLRRAEEARRYAVLSDSIRNAFNKAFYNPATREYATGSQCANAIPLVMGLADSVNRAAVLDSIVSDVRRRGNALTTGDVGYRYLLRALADGGRSDVIFDMINQSEKPGYGYQLKQGATSLTEAWNAERGSSQNHFMLGQIMEWFYHDLAGIQYDPGRPGFSHVIIRPRPVGDVKWVRASYNSVEGKITSSWEKSDGTFRLKVSIPPNTAATVFLPAGPQDEVEESGSPVSQVEGIELLPAGQDQTALRIPSGTYVFKVAAKRK